MLLKLQFTYKETCCSAPIVLQLSPETTVYVRSQVLDTVVAAVEYKHRSASTKCFQVRKRGKHNSRVAETERASVAMATSLENMMIGTEWKEES